MKYLYAISIIFCLSCFSLYAEKEHDYERVLIHVDKDSYVAGEDIWIKFYVIDENYQPSTLSKVGYVEICDTERPQMQLKLALEEGVGVGKIKIPSNLPSGIYQLSGYTRYMRNEGESVFFKRQIAIINASQQPDPDRFVQTESVGNIDKQKENPEHSTIQIKTDKQKYLNRNRVSLYLDNLPDNIGDLVVSVSRNDLMMPIDKFKWEKSVTNHPKGSFSHQWLPEYEGHIITGQIVPKPQDGQLLSSLAFVGEDVRYMTGQIDSINGTSYFYTKGIYGAQEIVFSIVSTIFEKTSYRMNLVAPFCEILPDKLPVLHGYLNDKPLVERYIGVQLQGEYVDTIRIAEPLEGYYKFPQYSSYDLDEYTRFSTVDETILEFVSLVQVRKVNGKKKIKVFLADEQRYNSGRSLVLLDGVPIHDHEDVLKYNPQNIKKINIYTGRYLFGGVVFEGIVSFVSYKGNLPYFLLDNISQQFAYECPSLPVPFEAPDYSNEVVKNFRRPDFRHTLYWNPDVKPIQGKSVELSFYTSDLSGEFNVVVEGITLDGKFIYGTAAFEVGK